jgi:drug/metabolite transporter (DMT)-like permease
VLSGMAIYALEFALWVAALSLVALSVAMPFAALAYCGVALASRFVLHEPLAPRRWFGTGLVALGVAIACLPGFE